MGTTDRECSFLVGFDFEDSREGRGVLHFEELDGGAYWVEEFFGDSENRQRHNRNNNNSIIPYLC